MTITELKTNNCKQDYNSFVFTSLLAVERNVHAIFFWTSWFRNRALSQNYLCSCKSETVLPLEWDIPVSAKWELGLLLTSDGGGLQIFQPPSIPGHPLLLNLRYQPSSVTPIIEKRFLTGSVFSWSDRVSPISPMRPEFLPSSAAPSCCQTMASFSHSFL